MRNTRSITALVLALLAAAPAAADEFVIFTNGNGIRVEKTRRDGKWLYMSLGADQEMAVLARQVKEVEVSPAALRSLLANSGLANVLGIGGGGGGASYTPPPVAEAYEAGEMVVEEAPPSPPMPTQAVSPAPPQGQDLTSRGRRGGGRFPRSN